MTVHRPSLALACLLLAGSAAAAPTLPLYVGKPIAAPSRSRRSR